MLTGDPLEFIAAESAAALTAALSLAAWGSVNTSVAALFPGRAISSVVAFSALVFLLPFFGAAPPTTTLIIPSCLCWLQTMPSFWPGKLKLGALRQLGCSHFFLGCTMPANLCWLQNRNLSSPSNLKDDARPHPSCSHWAAGSFTAPATQLVPGGWLVLPHFLHGERAAGLPSGPLLLLVCQGFGLHFLQFSWKIILQHHCRIFNQGLKVNDQILQSLCNLVVTCTLNLLVFFLGTTWFGHGPLIGLCDTPHASHHSGFSPLFCGRASAALACRGIIRMVFVTIRLED